MSFLSPADLSCVQALLHRLRSVKSSSTDVCALLSKCDVMGTQHNTFSSCFENLESETTLATSLHKLVLSNLIYISEGTPHYANKCGYRTKIFSVNLASFLLEHQSCQSYFTHPVLNVQPSSIPLVS